jgi:hypothetical protein
MQALLGAVLAAGVLAGSPEQSRSALRAPRVLLLPGPLPGWRALHGGPACPHLLCDLPAPAHAGHARWGSLQLRGGRGHDRRGGKSKMRRTAGNEGASEEEGLALTREVLDDAVYEEEDRGGGGEGGPGPSPGQDLTPSSGGDSNLYSDASVVSSSDWGEDEDGDGDGSHMEQDSQITLSGSDYGEGESWDPEQDPAPEDSGGAEWREPPTSGSVPDEPSQPFSFAGVKQVWVDPDEGEQLLRPVRSPGPP